MELWRNYIIFKVVNVRQIHVSVYFTLHNNNCHPALCCNPDCCSHMFHTTRLHPFWLLSQQHSFSSSSTCNFVHANKATFENAHVNMRLEDDARFDCLVGSDLMYDRQHCTALAASVARRLRPNGEAIIFLAVRSEELLIAFSKKCAKRGLSVGVYAPTKPHEDLEDFSETTGGHANRPLPESCNEYWDLVAEKFSTCLLSKDYASFAPLSSDEETSNASIRSTLEGRFAMVRVVLAEKEGKEEEKQQKKVESEENESQSLKGVLVGDVKSMRVKL